MFRGDGGPADVIADGSDFISFSSDVAINAAGLVAFSASSATVSGIFLGPDVDADAVIRAGDLLFGSTVNQHGTFHMRVTKIVSENALSSIASLVTSAQAAKPPVQRMADTVASYFVPAVIGASLLAWVVWWILAGW